VTPGQTATAKSDDLAGLNASSVEAKPEPLPIGIYILFCLMVLAALVSFLSSEGDNIIEIEILLASLLLGFGLLFRINLARKILIVLGVIGVVAALGSFVLLHNLEGTLARGAAKAQHGLTSIKNNPDANLTPQQRSQINTLLQDFHTDDKKNPGKFRKAYIVVSFELVENAVVTTYLCLPKVKRAFSKPASF
jgi:hypothetical protein